MDSLESQSKAQLQEILKSLFESDFKNRDFDELFNHFVNSEGVFYEHIWSKRTEAENRRHILEYLFNRVKNNEISLITAIRGISDPVLPGEPASFFMSNKAGSAKRTRVQNDAPPRFQEMPEAEVDERVRFHQAQTEAERLKADSSRREADALRRELEEERNRNRHRDEAESSAGARARPAEGEPDIHDELADMVEATEKLRLKARVNVVVTNLKAAKLLDKDLKKEGRYDPDVVKKKMVDEDPFMRLDLTFSRYTRGNFVPKIDEDMREKMRQGKLLTEESESDQEEGLNGLD